jgi:hypothetical protein
MKTRPAATLLAALALLLATPSPAEEPPGALAPGAIVAFHVADGEAGRQRVEAAIERAITGMSFVVRPFARSRLAASNRVFAVLTVRRDGADLVVDRDGSEVRSPADGSPVSWAAPDGKHYLLRQELTPGGLVQRFTAEDGERLNVLAIATDGAALRLSVTIRSQRLPAPLSYHLDYLRSPP